MTPWPEAKEMINVCGRVKMDAGGAGDDVMAELEMTPWRRRRK